MEEVITKVCNQLGMDEAVAKQAIGAILVFLKDQVTRRGGDFDDITSQLQGAIQLMENAPKTKEEAHAAAAHDDTTTTTTATTFSSNILVAWIQWILSAGPIFEILKKLLGLFFGEGAVRMLTSASESANLMTILNNLGISTDAAKSMIGILVSYMNTKLGPETMEQLAESVPALKPYLDATKKDE